MSTIIWSPVLYFWTITVFLQIQLRTNNTFIGGPQFAQSQYYLIQTEHKLWKSIVSALLCDKCFYFPIFSLSYHFFLNLYGFNDVLKNKYFVQRKHWIELCKEKHNIKTVLCQLWPHVVLLQLHRLTVCFFELLQKFSLKPFKLFKV